MQFELALEAEKLPGAHMLHRTAPPPSSRGPHEKLPGRHSEQTDEPEFENVPAKHALHAVCPWSRWKRPASHGLHTIAPSLLTVPGEHWLQAEAPIDEENLPPVQLVQEDDLLLG